MVLGTVGGSSEEPAAPIFRVEDSALVFYTEHGQVYPKFILSLS